MSSRSLPGGRHQEDVAVAATLARLAGVSNPSADDRELRVSVLDALMPISRAVYSWSPDRELGVLGHRADGRAQC